MGVREKQREKKKEKAQQDTVEVKAEEVDVVESQSVEEPQKSEVQIIQQEAAITPEEVRTATEAVGVEETKPVTVEIVLLPPWGGIDETEWMYSIPPREEDRQMWAEEWADFLLGWAEANGVHVLSVTMFIKNAPFKDIAGKVDSFLLVGEVLVKKEIAEWLDDTKRQLRVYWRYLEDWADIIYQWALRTGKLRLDIKSIVIQEEKQDFASLPEKDLRAVMRIMVDRGLADWVDKKKGAIKVKV
ncbi:MAG: hypothetical protein AM324_010845 [Candidatus Thorarchaeota archaeon SMTZ1-83]|nr:MAG: hypothetical protein AM324_12165 [Candidatus Thorarchaeota archaeon SMTZ1-83]